MNFAHVINIIDKKQKAILTLILLFIFSSGLFYSNQLGNKLRFPDEHDYISIAKNLVENQNYSLDGATPTAYRPPGYPLILTLLIFFKANVLHLRLLNYIMLCFSVLLLFSILKKNESSLSGVSASIIVFFVPCAFYASSTIYPQTIATTLFIAALYIFFRTTHLCAKDFFILGLLLGFLILMVPTFIFTLGFFCFWILFHGLRKNFKHFLVLITTSSLLILFWIGRNYFTFDSIVFISTNSGYNLLIGNSENTTPTGGVNVDISQYENEVTELNEIEKDKYFRNKAIDFIQKNPMKVLKLYFFKFLNYFNYKNKLYVQSESSQIKWLILFITYYPLLATAFLIRLLLLKKFPFSSLEIFSLLLYISNGLFAAIFFTRIRFRIPFDFLLVLVTASILGKSLVMWKKRVVERQQII